MQLRPYQQSVKDEVVDLWRLNPLANVLAVKPTGAGKTVTMASIIHDHNGPSCAIAHRQELVGQISQALAREGIRHRIIAPQAVIRDIVQAHTRELGQSWYDPAAQAAVAGVDTLLRRADTLSDWMRSVTLWVTDEAHHLLADNKWGRAAELFPNAKGLGVTATPLRADGAGLGRHADGVFDHMVEGPSMRWLIDNKYLTDYRIFAPPSDFEIDDSAIGSTGDYSAPKMRAAARKSHIIGDVVTHYQRITPGKLGVVFATDIEIATDIAAQFRSAGVAAEVVSSKTPDRERTAILRRFKARELTVLVNVDLFGEGFDLPAIEVVSMARPTMSYALYVQQFGRALRLMDGKTEAIIIDHVGNVQRHGLPDKPRIWSLDRVERRGKTARDPDMIPTRTCIGSTDHPGCMAVYGAIHDGCPYCGTPWEPAGRSRPEQVDGNLLELDPAVLAQMRGEVARIDETAEQVGQRMKMAGAPGVAVGGAMKNHRNRQDAQTKLRDTIALWAGYQRAAGRGDPESYKRFFWRYGIDVLGAQALGKPEAEALTVKIAEDLLTIATVPS